MERISVKLERLQKDSYEILIGQDIIDPVALMTMLKNDTDQYVIVTDSQVNPLYGDAVKKKLSGPGKPAHVIEVPAGEPSKSLETVVDVVSQLLRLGVSRSSR
jgi:3-dehydroquinate synthase